MMKALVHFTIVLCIFALGFGAGYGLARYRKPTGTALATSSSCYVYGTALDTQGRPLAGITVSTSTRSTTTNASGAWGQTWTVTGGQSLMLFVSREPASVEPPQYQRATVDGNILTLVIPQGVGGMLGPYVLRFAEPAPTWTPLPTWTVTRTATPMATATWTPTPAPYPTSAITSFWDVPVDIADEIAAEARLHYWEPLTTYPVAAASRLFRWGRALELGAQLTNEYESYVYPGTYYMAFAEGIVVEKDGQIGIISPHGRWRYWRGGEPE